MNKRALSLLALTMLLLTGCAQAGPDPSAAAETAAETAIEATGEADLVDLPDLTGTTVSEATDKLEEAGFTVAGYTNQFGDQVQAGSDWDVYDVAYPSGASAARGSAVTLDVFDPAADEADKAVAGPIIVPDVVGMTVEEAEAAIADAGMTVDRYFDDETFSRKEMIKGELDTVEPADNWVVTEVYPLAGVQLPDSSDRKAILLVKDAKTAAAEKKEEAEAKKYEDHWVIKYTVESDAAVDLVTYTNMVDFEMNQEQDASASKTKVVKTYRFDADKFGGSYTAWSFGVSAMAGGYASTITCRIEVNGREVAKQTSTGPYANVTCHDGDYEASF
ncbi:PASTA domain-containing protein [Arthrobacter mobilis]|uniref:PASTA domain-containing protein n=1 Tax=Arthrobacter mobilis TaxID=2724944 RepID=A0A7X6HF32_9MICC|nr:PASTA domain-containing protein [Arthrobacter mobilis]NKX55984.1 PASTA domain-containing protein [Arthrobacter mobilis]